MPETWLVRVYNNRVLETFKECGGTVELGRQDNRSREELYQLSAQTGGGFRVSIAPSEELSISRRHALVREIAGDRVTVRNVSNNNSIAFEDGYMLRPGQERQLDLPVVLKFGAKVVRIQRPTFEEAGRVVRSLDEPTSAPGENLAPVLPSALSLNAAAPLDARFVFNWLKAMIGVLESAATDADFFQKAAQAVVENAGLDMGRVLSRDGDGWETSSFHPAALGDYERSNPPSRLVLRRVCEQKKTSWLDPSELGEDCSSLAGVSSVVAAPVLARTGDVIAILYGERRLQSLLSGHRPITRLDAMLIDVLAFALAAGLARIEHQRAALALQTQFEQFFTPDLARQLLAHPELLAGQDREITVIFCDIRGFSRISRKHTAATILEWANDVLSTLSDCVHKHQGVLVDYIGDELMGMWGAPDDQPEHAERACRAALEMIASLPALNARWRERLGEPTALGIGVNTGIARVGNTGSQRKFKYGPLGDTVNVASRVQGTCKYFKSDVLITKETRRRLPEELVVRRLGKAYMVNISDAIELFELFSADQGELGPRLTEYEEALQAFESRLFRTATRILGHLVEKHPDDGPSIALLARTIACVVEEPEVFDPAFRFKAK